jgi:hypothetical protein
MQFPTQSIMHCRITRLGIFYSLIHAMRYSLINGIRKFGYRNSVCRPAVYDEKENYSFPPHGPHCGVFSRVVEPEARYDLDLRLYDRHLQR